MSNRTDKKRLKLRRAIMAANPNISAADAMDFADAIMAFDSEGGSNVLAKKMSVDSTVMTFGKYKGMKLVDCPEGYVRFISEIVESKKHTKETLACIRAARAILLEWNGTDHLPQDCPFD